MRIAKDGEHSVLVERENAGGAWSLAFSPDGHRLAAVCVDGFHGEVVAFWLIELATGRVIIERFAGTLHSSASVAFRIDGLLAVGPDPWPGDTCAAAARLFSHTEPLCETYVSWAAAIVAFDSRGHLVSRGPWQIMIGNEDHSSVDGYIAAEGMSTEHDFITLSNEGTIATNAGEDGVVLLQPSDLTALATSEPHDG